MRSALILFRTVTTDEQTPPRFDNDCRGTHLPSSPRLIATASHGRTIESGAENFTGYACRGDMNE